MRVVVAAVLLLGCKGTPAPDPVAVPQPAPPSVAASVAPTAKHGEAVRPHREESVVECPVTLGAAADDESRVAALLEGANTQISLAAYGAAWTCADRAADLMPTSVEAHHLRGSALAALGRDAEAQLAYSIALALDPDDPETLRAIADFYINGSKGGVDPTSKLEHGRDALRLGLELAQRGSRRVIARRRKTPQLAADLAVLEAQALNDLGRSDEALGRVEVALRHSPGRGDAMHEKGVALFDLSRFADARAALERAVAIQPEDAYSHQILGLALEALGDVAGGQRELDKALALAPKELSAPVLIDIPEFRKEIESVISSLAKDRQARVRAIKIEIADLPDPADLAAVKPPFPPTILGLYRGPVGKAHVVPASEGEAPSIVLYRRNLARAVKSRAELSEQIRDTLLHEIGHLEGLDEDDLRRRGME